MLNLEQRQAILQKITKANLRLSKQLDGTQIVDLLDRFVEATAAQISIVYDDFEKLMKLAASFQLTVVEGLPIKIQFKYRNELLCFLYVLEKKIGATTASQLIYVNILERMVQKATHYLSIDEQGNKRDEATDCLKLISLITLLNDNLTVSFNELCKKS